MTSLQQRFVQRLEAVSKEAGHDSTFSVVKWQRDGGRHGGGHRMVAADTPIFNRASVNVSQVHYDDLPDKKLSSATALSTIIHPDHPHAASMHMHISWTEMRDGSGYWRVMADLNPSIPETADREAFRSVLAEAAPDVFEYAEAQGDRYFTIPALDRTRGVAHFYLEGHATDDAEADRALAQRVGEQVIDTYGRLLAASLAAHGKPTDDERWRQLDYHTVYLFQVLTLDRGTTSGLLVHDQNDVGILGSLPSHVDRERLAKIELRLPSPQDELLSAIVRALPSQNPALIDTETKRRLANVVRTHYRRHPQALDMQARGEIVPPTVSNHSS
ncbi:MAG: coproporphyrinogen III oxidase [Myxococcota bacterium]